MTEFQNMIAFAAFVAAVIFGILNVVLGILNLLKKK